jgi:hypothetical protein
MVHATEQGLGNGGIAPPVAHRFQPGRSGNPGGRPKSRPITRALRRFLRQPVGAAARAAEDPGATAAEVLAARLLIAAAAGDARAAALLLDRVEGRVPQAVSHESQAGALRVVIQGDSTGNAV